MNNIVDVNGFRILVYPYKEYISEELRTKGGYEKQYIKLITSFIRPGDTVLDIGANIGLHTLHYSIATGNRGRVLAFEPDPANLAILRENVKRNRCNNVIVYPFALGNDNYIDKLYLCKRNKGYQGFADFNKLNDPIKVKVRKTSGISGALNATLVKMDVEGAEPLVFEGFDGFRPPIIFFEFSANLLLALKYNPLTFLNILVSEGYVLFVVNRDQTFPVSAEHMAKIAMHTKKDYNLMAKL